VKLSQICGINTFRRHFHVCCWCQVTLFFLSSDEVIEKLLFMSGPRKKFADNQASWMVCVLSLSLVSISLFIHRLTLIFFSLFSVNEWISKLEAQSSERWQTSLTDINFYGCFYLLSNHPLRRFELARELLLFCWFSCTSSQFMQINNWVVCWLLTALEV
jgi:hypothetical protein